MKFEEFKIIFDRLLKNKQFHEELDQYPSTYSVLIADDSYVNDLALLNDFLLEKLLPEHFYCVMWFLWEWRPGYTITQDGKEYVIMDKDGYLKFKQETWGKE